MFGLGGITWLLIQLTVWGICLVILIPLSVTLWVMLKDLFTNDGNKIKETMGSLHTRTGEIVQSQSNKNAESLPIKYADSTPGKDDAMEEESYESEPKVGTKGEITPGDLDEPVEKVEHSTMEKSSNSETSKEQGSLKKEIVKETSGGIIYLDRKTSLTTDFPDETQGHHSQEK